MSGSLAPVARQREFSDLGTVLPGAKLYTYVSGSGTPLATYSDPDLAVGHANPNPHIASAAGRFSAIYMPPGVAYRFDLKDSAGVSQPGYPADNVTASGSVVNVPATGAAGQVLTSNGVGVDPSWQAASGSSGDVLEGQVFE